MHEEDNSRVPVPFSDLRNSGIEAELETFMDTGSESFESFMSTDPGRVGTDFDAAMTTSGDYGYTPHQQYRPIGGGVPTGRITYSSRSYQPSHVKSPLQQSILPEELSSDLDSSDEEDEITDANMDDRSAEDQALIARYVATHSSGSGHEHGNVYTQVRSRPTSGAESAAPARRQTVSPFGPYQPPPPTEEDPALVPPSAPTTTAPPAPLENRVSLASRAQPTTSVTPRGSMEVAPPIETERIRKLVASINIALDWARTLTEVSSSHLVSLCVL
jgi:hypothetical protein